MTPPTTAGGRVSRFFFMHVGSIVAVIVFFDLFGRAGYSPEGLRRALGVGLAVMTAYVLLAWRTGELKQIDAGLWTMFAVGTLATRVGIEPLVRLYQGYSPALLFATLGTSVAIPLLLGREPFTLYYARRQLPAWQLRVPETHAVSRVLAWFTGGESLHNNHHAHPRSPKFSVGRFEFDPGWLAIKVFAALKLVGITGPLAKLSS